MFNLLLQFNHYVNQPLFNHHSYVPLCPPTHTGHVSADSDSAEDIADDQDAAVDEEEEDEEEVLVEEDQIQPMVCIFSSHSSVANHRFTCR